jgi:hypothetical protein
MTIMCERCLYVAIYFDPNQRGENGGLVPLEERTGLPHLCDFSYPKPCKHCGRQVYTDRKIVSLSGKIIPLDYGEDTYHFCKERPRPVKHGRLEV